MTEVSAAQPPRALRVGMIGYAFMGAVHAQAWRNTHRFFTLPMTPELTVVAGRDEVALRAAAERLGSASIETDWRRVIERDDVCRDRSDLGEAGSAQTSRAGDELVTRVV